MNHTYKNLIEPNNYLAEEVLIGYIMINPYSLNYITKSIHKESFFLRHTKYSINT